MSNPKPITRPIKFYNSMTFDSHRPGAVLRSKWLDFKDRLYPVVDIEDESLSNSFEPRYLLPSYAIGEDSTHKIAVYTYSVGSSSSTTFKAGNSTSDNAKGAVNYNNGTDELIYIVTSRGDLDTYNPSTTTYTENVHTENSSDDQYITVHPSYDDLFFITNKDVFRLSKGTYDGKVFDLPDNNEIFGFFPYGDNLVFITKTPEGVVRASAWDCDSTNTAFNWSYEIGRGRPLTAGISNGKIVVVLHTGDASNQKEYEGELKIMVYYGGRFVEKNSIPTLDSGFYSKMYRRWYSDGEYVYGLIGYDGHIIKPGVYRFSSSGEIVCRVTHPDVTNEEYYAVSFSQSGNEDIMVVAFKKDNGTDYLGQVYDSSGSSYSDFQEDSEYITGFLENGYDDKQLTEFYVDFEKIHTGEEEGHFYYRTSDEDSWVEIGKVDYDIDGEIDRIHFKRLLSGAVLPDFKKIQFKLTSREGLNITGAGYKFIYKDRLENTN